MKLIFLSQIIHYVQDVHLTTMDLQVINYKFIHKFIETLHWFTKGYK